ncbi:hypothetical protein CHUAL_004427 [Chamberlinius hualienensis]
MIDCLALAIEGRPAGLHDGFPCVAPTVGLAPPVASITLIALMHPELRLNTGTPTIYIQPQVSMILPATELSMGEVDPVVQTLGMSSNGDPSVPKLEWQGELSKQEPPVETSSPVLWVPPCAVQLLPLPVVIFSVMPTMVAGTLGSTLLIQTLFLFQL